MKSKDFVRKEKVKKNARDFKDLDEIREKQIVQHGVNKEVQVIYPVKTDTYKKEETNE